ncbi:large subunit ribosomal protein L6 [Catalinimonas alkaloidigena]|uniref:50S ribosomal protein L6 n=1 Tax=Catalinimonas alkaloidigena TaxID=1075417 RepID=UPI002406F04E|nr:50S ribosomal protein L6 [Catalinimonas alkaloidigena]MDF9795561.1 large subunit ribosomal protein L6 [Catalinimonas alkaloidigena]
MSRIGKLAIEIPQGVTVTNNKNVITVKGPKGELTQVVDKDIEVKIEDNQIRLHRPTEQKRHKALHGLYRALIYNMIEGVDKGYQKQLELVGVGYRATVQQNVLELNLGYSHNIFMGLPEGINASAETAKGKNPTITLESYDKQLIGQVAAKIKSLRPVEPYKGKGVRFVGERIRRKAGKTASK